MFLVFRTCKNMLAYIKCIYLKYQHSTDTVDGNSLKTPSSPLPPPDASQYVDTDVRRSHSASPAIPSPATTFEEEYWGYTINPTYTGPTYPSLLNCACFAMVLYRMMV